MVVAWSVLSNGWDDSEEDRVDSDTADGDTDVIGEDEVESVDVDTEDASDVVVVARFDPPNKT